MVSHRHITVNGSIVNIPSFQVKVGDVVGVREKSKSLNIIVEANGKDAAAYEWLSWNKEQLQGTFVSVPLREGDKPKRKTTLSNRDSHS